MKLPFIGTFFKKKVPADYFLALLFRDEKIHAVVFEQLSGRIQVVGQGKAALPQSLEKATDEQLLEACDKAISIAESSLNGITTHKTVFGVKETWVADAHITKDYLAKLKTISDQLDLKPIGFLVFPEAIAHLLQKEEGAPVSAILVEVGMHRATITLLRAGRIIGTQEVVLTDSLTTTVEAALAQFDNIEILPSRIVLFDTGDAEAEKKFLSHKWSRALPFLHVPQITTLPSDFDTRAILFGTATQMGFDAIDLVKQPLKKAERLFDEKSEEQDKTVILENEVIPESSSKNNEDAGQASMTEPEDLEEVTGQDTSEYFGFVKNTDVALENKASSPSPLSEDAMESVTKDIPEEVEEQQLAGQSYGFSLSGPIFFEGAKKIFAKIRHAFPKNIPIPAVSAYLPKNMPSFLRGNNKLLIAAPLLVVILLVGLLWYIFGLHGKVILFLTPKVISQDQTITFTTSGSSDPSQNLVAAQTLSVDEEGKVAGNATGSKDVGTMAKGTVTIFNSDSDSHTLSSGTTITSSNGLQFTLDHDVTVASGSSDPTNLSAGTADVTITASAIGTDYNLPSQTKFTIAGTSVLAAKNSNALSGGTKNTITVVAQKDLDNLTSQLTDQLKDKAKSELQSKISHDEVILPDFTNTTAGVTNFDKKVGDQTSSINLDGTITYETIAYKKSDIENYTKSALSGQLPSNMTLSSDGITYSVKDMTTKDGTTHATLTIKALLIPSLDTKSLSSQIAGKSFSQAKDILSAVPQYSDSTLTLSPNLFFLPKVLPRLSGNITFSIVAHE